MNIDRVQRTRGANTSDGQTKSHLTFDAERLCRQLTYDLDTSLSTTCESPGANVGTLRIVKCSH